MPAPTSTVTQPNINQQTGGLYADNGAFTTDGAGNVSAVVGLATSGVVLLGNKKLGATANGDLLDASGATQVRKLGPTSTKLQDNVAATTNNWTDANANQINSGAKSTFSTIAATNHNYAVSTPTIIVLNQQAGTATATAAGTIGATQYTPTGGVANTYVAEARLI